MKGTKDPPTRLGCLRGFVHRAPVPLHPLRQLTGTLSTARRRSAHPTQGLGASALPRVVRPSGSCMGEIRHVGDFCDHYTGARCILGGQTSDVAITSLAIASRSGPVRALDSLGS